MNSAYFLRQSLETVGRMLQERYPRLRVRCNGDRLTVVYPVGFLGDVVPICEFRRFDKGYVAGCVFAERCGEAGQATQMGNGVDCFRFAASAIEATQGDWQDPALMPTAKKRRT